MSVFLNKSQMNLAVADSLIEEDCKVASAHSAYYSLFLLAKHLLHRKLGISYADQEIICKNKRSHQQIQNQLIDKLGQIEDFEPNDIVQWYSMVHMMRNRVDYKPTAVSDALLRSNLMNALACETAINSHFNLY